MKGIRITDEMYKLVEMQPYEERLKIWGALIKYFFAKEKPRFENNKTNEIFNLLKSNIKVVK